MALGLGLNGLGPGAKRAVLRGKMGYALGQNAMCPGGKWVGA
jgi:hypothetical protein